MKCPLLLVLCFIAVNAFSNSDSTLIKTRVASIELGGSAGWWSANLEAIVPQNKTFKICMRAGGALNNLDEVNEKENRFFKRSPTVLIPVTLTVLFGKINHVEFGAGQTIINYHTGIYRETEMVTTGFLGYRYLPENGRISFKAGLTPTFFFQQKKYQLWAGVSFGYVFRTKK